MSELADIREAINSNLGETYAELTEPLTPMNEDGVVEAALKITFGKNLTIVLDDSHRLNWYKEGLKED